MYKILIVGEKWSACNPEFGLSAIHHNFIGSLSSTGLAEIQTFFYDEYAHNTHQCCDGALLEKCRLERPDFVILRLVRGTDLNPSLETLRKIRQHTTAKVVSIHSDTHDQFAANWMNDVSRHVDLIVVQDCYSIYPRHISDTDSFIDLWTPQDPSIFHLPDANDRSIDVTFMGSVDRYTDRKIFIGMLQEHQINVTQKGGLSENQFSIVAYANHLRHSRIALNFSRPVFDEPNHHCKGRTVEITLCGALLMEQENPETKKWFRPGIDYVSFTNERDLVAKVNYYLTHEEERHRIASHGHMTASMRYSADQYWKTLFGRLKRDE
mgnify:CR=1 FL=1